MFHVEHFWLSRDLASKSSVPEIRSIVPRGTIPPLWKAGSQLPQLSQSKQNIIL